jgi:methanethiol S-methyltransferase
MKKGLLISYVIFTYIFSIVSMTLASLWLLNLWLPKTIDSGTPGPFSQSLLIDTVLLFIFCFVHTYFARSSVKVMLRRCIPEYLERATYCLLSSVLWLMVCLFWRPLPSPVWEVTSPASVTIMYVLFVSMWVIHFAAIFMMNHNEFFGLRTVFFAVRNEPHQTPPAVSEGYYYVSHVLLVASLTLLPWAAPTMSIGHLYLCIFLTVYMGIGAFRSHRDIGGFLQLQPRAESAA